MKKCYRDLCFIDAQFRVVPAMELEPRYSCAMDLANLVFHFLIVEVRVERGD